MVLVFVLLFKGGGWVVEFRLWASRSHSVWSLGKRAVLEMNVFVVFKMTFEAIV